MKRKSLRKFSIKKNLTAFLGLSLVSLVVFGFIALNGQDSRGGGCVFW